MFAWFCSVAFCEVKRREEFHLSGQMEQIGANFAILGWK
jgi:hypothetical protein